MRQSKFTILFIVFKYRAKLFLPPKLWNLIYKFSFKKYFDQRKYQEQSHITSKQEPKFFVIRRRPPGAGLFSNVAQVIQGIIRAESIKSQSELIPMVDFENYFMDEMHCLANFPAKSNSWTHYFLQLAPYELDDIYKNHSYILSGEKFSNDAFMLRKNLDWVFDEKKFRLVSRVIEENIHPNFYLQEKISKWKELIEWKPQSTLALGVRGGTYVKYKYSGHPVQPSINEVIPEVENYLNRYAIDKIYLQTHDYKIYEDLKRRFGGKILKSYSMSEYDSLFDFERRAPKDRPNHWDKVPKLSFEANYRYLIDVFLMSEANFFISALTNGTAFALAKNGKKFVDFTILKHGYYE